MLHKTTVFDGYNPGISNTRDTRPARQFHAARAVVKKQKRIILFIASTICNIEILSISLYPTVFICNYQIFIVI